MKSGALRSVFFCLLFFSGSVLAGKHVIGSWNAGFFSAFLGVLNHLYWCEKTGDTPAVYWGKENLYWQEGGYNGSLNAWEYFFEPVSSLPVLVDEPQDRRYSIDGWTFAGYEISDEKRLLANHLIKKYVKLNSVVNTKVELFFSRLMAGKKTIGIHLRGTDKHAWEKAIDPEIILARANKEAEPFGECQFLVATDEYRLLALAEKVLKRPVIYYPCERSGSLKPLHGNTHKAILGEDVLIEALLLARCDLFLHIDSNVSAAALYFNPSLKNIFFTK